MAGESKTTTDHEFIRKWAEEREGKPATVDRPGEEDDDEVSVLRIDFPGYSGSRLREISWDEFFAKFDEKKLAFLYQEETRDGKESRFFKLVSQGHETEHKNGHATQHKNGHEAEHKNGHTSQHKNGHDNSHAKKDHADDKASHKVEAKKK